MGGINVSAEDLHTALTQQIRKLESGADWARWLDAAALLPTYGFGNVVLITLQMPQANWVAAAHSWERMGRKVRESRAIKILAPVHSSVLVENERSAGVDGTVQNGIIGFKVARVWDVAHTIGPPVSLPPVGRAPVADLWSALSADAQRAGFDIDRRWVPAETPSYTDYSDRLIVISNQLDTVTASAHLAHEVGHVRMHPTSPAGMICGGMREIEADSFAHIALAYFGLSVEASSFEALPGRASSAEPHSPESVIKATGARVVNAARGFLETTGRKNSLIPRTAGIGLDVIWQAPPSGLEL